MGCRGCGGGGCDSVSVAAEAKRALTAFERSGLVVVPLGREAEDGGGRLRLSNCLAASKR